MKGSGRRAPITMAVGALMAFDAATFFIAATLHLNARIPLGFGEIGGEWFPRATIPEAIIAFVLALGASIVLFAPVRAWAVAAATALLFTAKAKPGLGRMHQPSLQRAPG